VRLDGKVRILIASQIAVSRASLHEGRRRPPMGPRGDGHRLYGATAARGDGIVIAKGAWIPDRSRQPTARAAYPYCTVST